VRRIARELALPFVVTNDSHYSQPGDAKAHEVLLCVQTATNLADPGRFKFDGTGYYLKSPQEMRAVSSDEEWQAGCDSTLLIAERADVSFAKANLMPQFPVPGGQTEEGCFRKQVWRGMDRRYPDGHDEQRRERAEFEMGIIRDGVLLVLPGGRGLHHVGQEQRDQGRAGPRLGGGQPRVLRARHHRPRPDR